jgi:hypothetical protein
MVLLEFLRRKSRFGAFSSSLRSVTGGFTAHRLCWMDLILYRAVGPDLQIHHGRNMAGRRPHRRHRLGPRRPGKPRPQNSLEITRSS